MAQFDEAYYAHNYRNYARQNPRRKLQHYRRALEQHMDPAVPRRVHDVGCAFGDFLIALGPTWERYGSDLSAYSIGVARMRAPEVVFRDGPVTVHDEVRFGAVSAFDVLEHVPDLDAAGDAVCSQLLPGGVFLFVVPVYDGLSGPVIHRLDRDPTHLHKWPRSRWLSWAARRFDVLTWHGLVRYLLPGGYYVHISTRTGRAHTPAILVACRRARPTAGA